MAFDPLLPPTAGALDAAVSAIAVALGSGLLIGIERERRKGSGPGRSPAGLRSFSLAAVVGAVATLLGGVALAAVGALFIAALAVVAYARDRSDDPGVTSEIALFLTYLIGMVATWSPALAAGLAAGLTAMLAAREHLHAFARHWLRPGEVRDGIILASIVLIAIPLVPDRVIGATGLNPRPLVRLLALLLAIQSLAHLSRRFMQARQAVGLSAVAAGFVSSTATIASLGVALRDGQGTARGQAGAALLSCVATMLQTLVVASAVRPAWLPVLAGPCLAGAVVAGLHGAWLLRGADFGDPDGASASGGDEPMFSLRAAAVVAGLLTAIQLGVHGLERWLGDAGLIGATLLASLFEVHAALAAVMTHGGPTPLLVQALVLGLSVHAVSKSVTAGLSGGRAYLAWVVPGLLSHTAACVGWLLVFA